MGGSFRRVACALLAGWLVGGCVLGLGTDADGAEGSDGAPPCLETKRPISGNTPTPLGFSANEALQHVRGDHVSAMKWTGGSSTRIHIDVGDPRVWYVESRANPSWNQPYVGRHCAHHVRIETDMRIYTEDGKLDEAVDRMVLIAYGSDEAFGKVEINGSALRGTYEPELRTLHCYFSSELRVLFLLGGVHGSWTDKLHANNCDVADLSGLVLQAGGHWGSRWQSY